MTITEIRPPEIVPAVCPPWCIGDHKNLGTAHATDPIGVELSAPQDDADKHVGKDLPAVLVDVQQQPGRGPLVHLTHHDGTLASEDILTIDEAEKLAGYLKENAGIIRANGDHTCWCDGMHTPGDAHWGEPRDMRLAALPHTPGMMLAIVREWDAPAAVVQLVSHTETDWDYLTADEAERLAAALQVLAATIRNGS